MSEKTRVNAWSEVRIRRTDTGWDYCMATKDGAIIGKVPTHAKTFDEAVVKAKQDYDVS